MLNVECPFRRSDRIQSIARQAQGIMDKDELKEYCLKNKVCPYV